MKKQLLLLTMILLPVIANADAVEIDGIYYNLITKGKVAEVTRNPNNYSGSVIIPDKITFEGTEYLVTNIGLAAFEWSSELTSVSIPNSVTSIGNEAFWGCKSLTSITIPNSVISIGQYVFCECYGLISVDLPNSITSVTEGAFMNCTSLTSIVIPNNVTSIGYKTFAGCYGLTSITIGNSVTSIGQYAFLSCTGLTSITIPNSVEFIDAWAFWNCTGLTSVTFPNSVTKIGNFAFQDCNNLTSITLGSGIKFIGLKAFVSCPKLTDVYCNAESVPTTNSNVFENSYIEYATLHVPAESVNAYKAAEPWKNFKNVVSLEDSDTPEPPETQKCVMPTISYTNGKLTFNCETEGAECQYTISDNDIMSGAGNEVQLEVTYTVNVYATKAGYENSETATATLCWIDQQPQTEGITNGVASVSAKAVMIQSDGGVLTIQGADDGTYIGVYGTDGTLAGSAISQNGTAHVTTSLQPGSIAIVKIGEKSVKVMVK